MPNVHLYRIDCDAKGEKTNVRIGLVKVDTETFQDVKKGYKTPWLDANGYSRSTHFLREHAIIETSEKEKEALAQWTRNAKAIGLLPSVADKIIAKLAK